MFSAKTNNDLEQLLLNKYIENSGTDGFRDLLRTLS